VLSPIFLTMLIIAACQGLGLLTWVFSSRSPPHRVPLWRWRWRCWVGTSPGEFRRSGTCWCPSRCPRSASCRPSCCWTWSI